MEMMEWLQKALLPLVPRIDGDAADRGDAGEGRRDSWRLRRKARRSPARARHFIAAGRRWCGRRGEAVCGGESGAVGAAAEDAELVATGHAAAAMHEVSARRSTPSVRASEFLSFSPIAFKSVWRFTVSTRAAVMRRPAAPSLPPGFLGASTRYQGSWNAMTLLEYLRPRRADPLARWPGPCPRGHRRTH